MRTNWLRHVAWIGPTSSLPAGRLPEDHPQASRRGDREKPESGSGVVHGATNERQLENASARISAFLFWFQKMKQLVPSLVSDPSCVRSEIDAVVAYTKTRPKLRRRWVCVCVKHEHGNHGWKIAGHGSMTARSTSIGLKWTSLGSLPRSIPRLRKRKKLQSQTNRLILTRQFPSRNQCHEDLRLRLLREKPVAIKGLRQRWRSRILERVVQKTASFQAFPKSSFTFKLQSCNSPWTLICLNSRRTTRYWPRLWMHCWPNRLSWGTSNQSWKALKMPGLSVRCGSECYAICWYDCNELHLLWLSIIAAAQSCIGCQDCLWSHGQPLWCAGFQFGQTAFQLETLSSAPCYLRILIFVYTFPEDRWDTLQERTDPFDQKSFHVSLMIWCPRLDQNIRNQLEYAEVLCLVSTCSPSTVEIKNHEC